MDKESTKAEMKKQTGLSLLEEILEKTFTECESEEDLKTASESLKELWQKGKVNKNQVVEIIMQEQ